MDAYLASVPLEPLPLPKEVLKNGLRLDGRGFEEFRSVCEFGKYVGTTNGLPVWIWAVYVHLVYPKMPC